MEPGAVDWPGLRESSFEERHVAWAWLWALATYGVGDVATTVAIVWFDPRYTEANPVVRAAIEAFGGGGFLAVKLLVLYALLGLSLWGVRDGDPLFVYGPPLGLGVVGLVATATNLALLCHS